MANGWSDWWRWSSKLKEQSVYLYICIYGPAKYLTFSVLISYSDRRKGKRSCYVGLFQMDYIGVRVGVRPAAFYWIQVLVSGYKL